MMWMEALLCMYFVRCTLSCGHVQLELQETSAVIAVNAGKRPSPLALGNRQTTLQSMGMASRPEAHREPKPETAQLESPRRPPRPVHQLPLCDDVGGAVCVDRAPSELPGDPSIGLTCPGSVGGSQMPSMLSSRKLTGVMGAPCWAASPTVSCPTQVETSNPAAAPRLVCFSFRA
jgi:hypothetical protein